MSARDAREGPDGHPPPRGPFAELLARAKRAVSAPPDRGLYRPLAVRETPFPQRDVQVDGLRVRYVDVGPRDGGSPLVLLPGHTSRIEEYDAIVPTLARRRRVLVLDFPGSGYSDKPDRHYSLDFYERTLVGFLDALGIGRADLGGGSLGANLALRLGHRHPDRFGRLVAWAPAGAWEPQPRLARAFDVLAGYSLFWPMVWGQSRFWFEKRWSGRAAALTETFAYYREVIGPGFVRMYWGLAIDQVRRTLFDRAREIRQPTLVAWGDQDDGMNLAEGAERLGRLLPRCELVVVPGARHSLAVEVPHVLGPLVDDFLGR